MNLYINDISYQPQVVNANPHHLISDFIDVSDRAKNFLFEKIVMPDDYKIREITQNFTFISYQGTAHYKDITNERFKSLLANQLVKIATDVLDESIQYVYYKETDSYYFKKALNRKVPVVSFRTLDEFDSPALQIVNKYFDDAEIEVSKSDTVLNVSHKDHFTSHKQYFNEQAYKIAKQNDKWFLVNKQGNKINNNEYDDIVKSYKESELYTVYRNNKRGFVNIEGKEIIPLVYKKGRDMGIDIYAATDDNGTTTVFDKKGKQIF